MFIFGIVSTVLASLWVLFMLFMFFAKSPFEDDEDDDGGWYATDIVTLVYIIVGIVWLISAVWLIIASMQLN